NSRFPCDIFKRGGDAVQVEMALGYLKDTLAVASGIRAQTGRLSGHDIDVHWHASIYGGCGLTQYGGSLHITSSQMEIVSVFEPEDAPVPLRPRSEPMSALSILELVRVTEETDARAALDNARDLAAHAEN